MESKILDILKTYPFLSYGKMGEVEYIGIVQNYDSQLVSMYSLDQVPPELREEFLTLGLQWWWGSNRLIPINIFLKERFRKFRPYLKHFSSKDFDLVSGHAVSLSDTISRKIRKRQVTLVCKMK